MEYYKRFIGEILTSCCKDYVKEADCYDKTNKKFVVRKAEITIEDMKKIQKMKWLKIIDFNYCRDLYRYALRYLPTGIEEINLAGCCYKDETNGIERSFATKELAFIFPFLSLTRLNLSKSGVGNDILQYINQGIRELDLSGTEITTVALHFIVRKFKSLEKLVLSGCDHISGENLVYLADLNLSQLDLSFCKEIGKYNLKVYFETYLKKHKNPKLRELTLDFCVLTDELIEILAKFNNLKIILFCDERYDYEDDCEEEDEAQMAFLTIKSSCCLMRSKSSENLMKLRRKTEAVEKGVTLSPRDVSVNLSPLFKSKSLNNICLPEWAKIVCLPDEWRQGKAGCLTRERAG